MDSVSLVDLVELVDIKWTFNGLSVLFVYFLRTFCIPSGLRGLSEFSVHLVDFVDPFGHSGPVVEFQWTFSGLSGLKGLSGPCGLTGLSGPLEEL